MWLTTKWLVTRPMFKCIYPITKSLVHQHICHREQQCDTSFDFDCGFTYLFEAQVHQIPASSQAKQYFTTISLSTTGSVFIQVKYQIGTAATCNTMSLNTLHSLLPDAEFKWSPYSLYPYGTQNVGTCTSGWSICTMWKKEQVSNNYILCPSRLLYQMQTNTTLKGDNKRLGLIKSIWYLKSQAD